MLTFSDRPPSLPGAPIGWSDATSWLWCGASANSFARFPPDVEDPDLLTGIVHLSASWRALVFRDGISFVGLLPDAGDGFFRWGETYVRTIYSDVVALALMQRAALNSFANRLAGVGDRFHERDTLRDLSHDVTEFRNVYWWDDVTLHGPANKLLRALQSANRTNELFARVVEDLSDFKRQVDAEAAERAAQAQELEERRSRRFDQLASALGITFAVPALVLTMLGVSIKGVTAGRHAMTLADVSLVLVVSLAVGALVGLATSRRLRRGTPEVPTTESEPT
jgi:hypothetical protein